MGDPIDLEVTEDVARLQLSRPDAANAFDLPTSRAFGAAVDRAAENPEVRAVLLTGAGDRFCAGGDVRSIAAADDPPAYLHELALDLDDALQRLAAMPKPVVAVVQGAVAGAGLGVMLSCDMIVAAEETKFVFAYPGIGLTPDCGVSWLLPRAIGQQRALAFALGDRPVTADVALDWGLVTEVSADALCRGRELATSWPRGRLLRWVRYGNCYAPAGSSTAAGPVRRRPAPFGGWSLVMRPNISSPNS